MLDFKMKSENKAVTIIAAHSEAEAQAIAKEYARIAKIKEYTVTAMSRHPLGHVKSSEPRKKRARISAGKVATGSQAQMLFTKQQIMDACHALAGYA